MNKKQINEFLCRLHGGEGCNFRKDKKGEIIYRCRAASEKYNEHNLSRKILGKMGISKLEQEKFLNKCKKLGGYCDCEILFNAAEDLLKERKESK